MITHKNLPNSRNEHIYSFYMAENGFMPSKQKWLLWDLPCFMAKDKG